MFAMASLPSFVYFAICLAFVMSGPPLVYAAAAADDPTPAAGLTTSASDMGEVSGDGKAIASSLVHMHFLYMQCLGGVGRRCVNITQYNCAKTVRSRSADADVNDESGCLTVSVEAASTGSSVQNQGLPCFAEAWLPKAKLRQLSPGSESVSINVINETGQIIGESTVDLSPRGLRRYPWVFVDLLQGNTWRGSFVRLCPATEGASATAPLPIISPSRLGGRRRHSFKIDEIPFVMTGFARTNVLRLDEFLRGVVPQPPDNGTADTKSSSSRVRRQTRLTQLIRRHGSIAVSDPATSTSPPPSSGLPQSLYDRTTRPCNRTSLSVSFRELSPTKNVVLFPASLQIFDCVGVCTGTLQAASAHAYLMRTIRSQGIVVGGAERQQRMSHGCCVPMLFESEPINLLVDDGQSQSIFPITNPTVKSCGCT